MSLVLSERSRKEGESAESISLMAIDPVVVVVASSMTQPVVSALMTQGSSAPEMLTVKVVDVVAMSSEAVSEMESVTESPWFSSSIAVELGV